jgi:tetratricopeptide (TPR) repeat protein
MERLKRLFARRSFPDSREPAPKRALPADILELTNRRQAGVLAAFVEDELKKDRASPLIAALITAVSERVWPPAELAKLHARIKFYAKDYLGCHHLAIQHLHAEQPDAEILSFAVLSLYCIGDYDAAYTLFKHWIEFLPIQEPPQEFVNLAIITLLAGGRIRECEPWLRIGLEKYTDNPQFCANALTVFMELGDREATERIKAIIQQLHPDYAEAQFSLGYALLAEGNYPLGLATFEARFKMLELGKYIRPSLLTEPRWNGQTSPRGKKILVHAEQGLGDTVMLARYLPDLEKLASEITMECQPAAIPLLAPNFPRIRFIPLDNNVVPKVTFDLWIGSMSLPHLFGSTVTTIPAPQGYLALSGDHKAYWSDRVATLAPSRRPRIGLAWSGNPAHRADRRRSIPFAVIREYVSEMDADFFALQTSVPAVMPRNLHNVTEELVTLADTAALIQQMDLVITVDTSIVHLAGAIGHPAWLLLPHRYE